MTDLQRLNIIIEGLKLLPPKLDTPAARQMLAAIAFQESNYEHRHQIGGPAHGFWQFEKGGGTIGVMSHRASKKMAMAAASALNIEWSRHRIFDALYTNDELACAFARLLLYTDPRPLPTSEAAAWEYYIRNWRPGKPHLDRWPECWRKAKELINLIP